jgi:polysaccharide pyruvyl transferase WcaK-like protein
LDERAHDGYYLQRFLFPGVQITQTIEQTLAMYASCDAIIGMRLHSIILSLVYETPIVAISYGRKTQSILEQNSVEYLNPKALKAEEVFSLLDKKLQNL